MLYRFGALDDRQPQQMILRDVLGGQQCDETHIQLARRYLWASFDCMDYRDGVMLIHPALAEPRHLIAVRQRRVSAWQMNQDGVQMMDILPEEIPLQRDLECAIAGALRAGQHAHDVVRTIRLLCKQGAPLHALEELLQQSLVVYVSPFMRGALKNMYYRLPKWIECTEHAVLQ